MGTKTDLEIFGLIAKEMGLNLGIWLPDKVFEEIRKTVHGYDVPLPVLGDRRRGADHAAERTRGGAPGVDPIRGRHAIHLRLAHALFQDPQRRDGISRQAVRRQQSGNRRSRCNYLLHPEPHQSRVWWPSSC